MDLKKVWELHEGQFKRLEAEYCQFSTVMELVADDLSSAVSEIKRKHREKEERNPPSSAELRFRSAFLDIVKLLVTAAPAGRFYINPMKAVFARLTANPQIFRSLSHPSLVIEALRRYGSYDTVFVAHLMSEILANPGITAKDIKNEYCYLPDISQTPVKTINGIYKGSPEIEKADFLQFVEKMLIECLAARHQALRSKYRLTEDEKCERLYIRSAIHRFKTGRIQ